jgi:hypothetical protein
MSDKNPDDLTFSQTLYARVININGFGLPFVIFFHITAILYATSPILGLLAAAGAAVGVYRYYVWLKQSPEQLPAYVMPLMFSYLVVIVTFLMLSFIFFKIIPLEVLAVLFYGALLWFAYKLWPSMHKYVAMPFVKAVLKR